MKSPLLRAVALTTLLTFATSTVGCGYILYPERRGNHGGTVDGGTLVMDLLWLLPGIVPGVIFLIVDFTSGAMYVNGRMAMRAAPNGNIALQLKDSPTPATIELRVVTASHRVLDDRTAQVGPTIHHQSVELRTADRRGEKLFLQILDPAHPGTPLQAPIEVL
jgi:hypothetical protein